MSDTGRRRLIGCLKLQFTFRKRATNHCALVRKMTYEDKAFYDSTPPCTLHTYCTKCSQRELAYVHACACACVRVCACVCMCVHVCMCMCVCAHVCTCLRMCVRVHIYAYTYTYDILVHIYICNIKIRIINIESP